MEVLGIIISLFLLMLFAYRGFPVILFAPIFALLAAATQGLSLMPAYTELFMTKAVAFVKAFFPIFMLGAVFGKIMEDSGLAKAIAHSIISKLGRDRALLSVVLACTVLTYCGVSLFVVVFAVYPFAASLFKEADIPKRLIPGTIALGSFTYTMVAFPGTSQIQNIIPTNFFGTTIYAAPMLGTIGGLLIFAFGMVWLTKRLRHARKNDEGYGQHTLNEPEVEAKYDLPVWYFAVLPLLTVLIVNYAMTNIYNWDPNMLQPFISLKLPLMAPSIKNVIGIWSLVIALVMGIILAVALGYSRLSKAGLIKALNAGTVGSLLAIMNTASVVGFGNVIASLPGFKAIAAALLGIQGGGNPLVSEAVTVATLASITGSASGGMSIALNLMANDWMTWANNIGMSLDILHRVATVASGGPDTLPHNGAVITLLAVCGLTHSQSYSDIFAITIIKTVMVFVVIALYLMFGIV